MASNYEEAVGPRKLTPAEMQKSVERLTRTTRQPIQLRPVVKPTYISQAELERSIKHLYDESLDRRERTRQEIDREVRAATMKDARQTSTAPLTAAEEEQMVKRLHDDTLARRKERLKELERQDATRYRATAKAATASPSADAADPPTGPAERVDRLYRGGMEREREKRIALYEQYVLSRRPPAPRRTREQLAESSEKMTKGESVIV